MSIDQKVLDRVRKMLALAGNNPSQEEAETALLKAQQYMAKHNISISDVEIQEEQSKEVLHNATPLKKYAWWEKNVAAVVAENFRCESYISNFGRKGSKIIFLGLKEDAEIALEVFGYAVRFLKHHANNFAAAKRKQGYTTSYVTSLKNTFTIGFIAGLKQKFAEQVERNNWGLVLVIDALVIKEKASLELSEPRKISIYKSGDAKAWEDGFEKGRSFDDSKSLLTEGGVIV